MAKKELKNQLVAQQPKVDFDAWWAITNKKLPPQHRKEIVMVDFKARGLSLKESISTYNKALEQYGVKLK
jgi:hypothetical protein